MISAALDHQHTFRMLMDAMAHPGRIKTIRGTRAPRPLTPAAASILKSLADYETPVWLDRKLFETPPVREWVRFTTGAPIVEDLRRAAFAVIADPTAAPDLSEFAQGDDEYPDRSSTLILQVETLGEGEFVLAGPGIEGTQDFAAAPLPADFLARWAANRTRFPRGVDLVLVAGDGVAALPRSVRVSRKS